MEEAAAFRRADAAPCNNAGVVEVVFSGIWSPSSSNEVSFWTGFEREKVLMTVGRVGEEKGLLL